MKRQYRRYDKEQLTSLIKQSVSFSDVCRLLNKRPVGGTITNMKLMCDRMGINYSHMTGSVHNKGKPAKNRKKACEHLVMGNSMDHRVSSNKIRRSLFELGVDHKCNSCGIVDWNGLPLVLEIDHIDEQYWNNTKENLQFLCPNCHAQKTKKALVAKLVDAPDLGSDGKP